MRDIVIELDSNETAAARLPDGRGVRRWAVLAGAALVLLSMSGQAGPAGSAEVTLVSVLADPTGGKGIRALADDVFVAGEPEGVAAYELDGRKRWSARTQHPVVAQDLIGILGDLVVVSSQTNESGNLITAFDAVTGARRWQLDGRLVRMGERRGDPIAFVHDDHILRVYDLQPLRSRWQLSGVSAAAVDYQTRSVVALFADATITMLDLDSGARRVSSRIPRAVGGRVSVYLEPDLVSIYASWTPTGPLEIQLLTADTLQPAESNAAHPDFAARSPGPSADPPIGTRWADPAGWTPLPQQDGAAPAPAPVTLLTQPAQGDRTMIARVQGQRLQVLGTLAFEIDRCLYHSPTLVCSVPQQRLAVWRIAPGKP